MISKYTFPRMGQVWSLTKRFDTWLEIEILACEAQAELGLIPKESAKEIRSKASYDLEEIAAIEKQVRHDVVAFLTSLANHIGPDARYVHLGMTSSDVLDTTLAVLMREAGQIIIEDIDALAGSLKTKAVEYKRTPILGRTHGIQAEPTSVGLKFLSWYEEVVRNRRRMVAAVDEISFGKISGAVGNYGNISPDIEKYVCEKLELRPEPVSTQIVQRDRHAQYLSVLAVIAASIERFATEVRSLQRSEIGELEEPFRAGQKGSSAMPHKRNPIICERMCGLARLVRTNALAGLENIALWGERDISHSSSERVIIPDNTIMVDYMLRKFKDVIDGIAVHEERMLENISMSKGLVFSERVLLELVKKGLSREEAYKIVQRSATAVLESDKNLRDVLLEDKELTNKLTTDELDACFDMEEHLKYVDRIFERVGVE
jgi:adenylosuccinate lyase